MKRIIPMKNGMRPLSRKMALTLSGFSSTSAPCATRIIPRTAAFHETYLEMVEKYDLPWCSCELFNDFPKHLVIWEKDFVEGDVSQWVGATVEDYTLTYSDGSTKELKICKELVDVFTKYTMD